MDKVTIRIDNLEKENQDLKDKLYRRNMQIKDIREDKERLRQRAGKLTSVLEYTVNCLKVHDAGSCDYPEEVLRVNGVVL